MEKKIQLSLITATLAFATNVMADTQSVNSLEDMFTKGTTSGQVRLGYFDLSAAQSTVRDQSATAIGGQLKFETAEFNGISLGTAMYTSHAIRGLSGNQDLTTASNNQFSNDLTSSSKSYTELAEAYVNYANNGFNFRVGRQLIDTPLADSDDIRMTPHTFEAYMASYELEGSGLTFMAANLQRWQGVDADYANVTSGGWAETGEDGTWMGATTYEKDNLAASLWFYDISKAQVDSVANKAIYADLAYIVDVNSDTSVTLAGQYLTESESDNSAVDGSISGVMVEAGIGALTLMGAYNQVNVNDGKAIFEGFGGGSSFTNMDTNTAGFLHDGTTGGGSSYVVSAGYDISGVNVFAAYGNYKADAIANGTGKQHATEIDLGAEYTFNDGQIEAALYYVMGDDKESAIETDKDDDHVQLTLNYNF